MIAVKCIEKIKKNNKITAYKLKDAHGKTLVLDTSDLKVGIKSGNINVVNLRLTYDNRLISTEQKHKRANTVIFDQRSIEKIRRENRKVMFKSNINNIETMLAKARVIGSTIIELKENMYAVENNETLIIVSDKQIELPEDCKELFSATAFKSIDFHNVDTSHVESMISMFYDNIFYSLDLSSLDTSKVIDMASMFSCCNVLDLNLSSFNTSNVLDMSGMFEKTKFNSLNISSFDTSKVTDMCSMFEKCEIKKLDLRNFNTSNVKSMDYMFYLANIVELDISSFDTSNVTEMCSMFSGFNTNKLDIRHFNIGKAEDMSRMFSSVKCEELDVRGLDLSNVRYKGKILHNCKIGRILK